MRLPSNKWLTFKTLLQLQKLKSKIFHKYTAFFAVSALILGGVFLYPFKSMAAMTPGTVYTSDQISFTESLNNNFFKITKGDSIDVKVIMTLNTPSKLVMGSGLTESDAFKSGNSLGDEHIRGVAIGAVNKTKNDTTCHNDTSILGLGQKMFDCNFPYRSSVWPDVNIFKSVFVNDVSTWTQGTSQTFDIALSSSDLENLGVQSSATGTVNEIYLYPYFSIFDVGDNVAMKPAKSIFIQAFDTSAQTQSSTSTADSLGIAANGSASTTPDQAAGGGVGNTLLGLINDIIGGLLGILQEIVYAIFFWLIAPMIQAMLSIQSYTDTFVAVIYPGWIVVRNICNIFLIVALLVIALATLFRVESYQYKHLLVQLILGALLVNFSLVIAQAILALADTVQAQFLPANVTVIRSLAGNLMVGYRGTFTSANFFNGTFAGTVQPFFWLALSIGSLMVFSAIAAYLLIRIVMLWVLLLVSPLAYAVGVLPSTAHYRSEWWSKFLKYAFFTPIMAFCLNMAAVMANASKTNPVLQQMYSASGGLTASLGGSDLAAFVFSVSSNILILVFLLAGLMVAEQAGVIGAGTINGWAKKGAMAPFKFGAKVGMGYAGRRWNEYTSHLAHGRKMSLGQRLKFAALNPVAAVKSWKARSEKLQEEARGEAEAVGLMAVEQTLTGGTKAFNRKVREERAHDAEFEKGWEGVTREEAVGMVYDLINAKENLEGRASKRAIIGINMSEGWIDDIIMDAKENQTGKGKELIEKMRNLKGAYKLTDDDFIKDESGNYIKDDEGNRTLKYNSKTRRAMLMAMFGQQETVDHNGKVDYVIADQTAANMIAERGEKYGKDTGHAEYMGEQVYDAKANHGLGGYTFRELGIQEDGEHTDETGEKYTVKNGYAVDGKYKGQLMVDFDKGAEHSESQVAKWGERQQAAVAPHALMDLGDGRLKKGMFRVVSKAFNTNAGFMQERTANLLLTGTTDKSLVKKVSRGWEKSGTLTNISEASKQRILDMAEESPEALVGVMSKFLNNSDKEGIVQKGLKIKIGDKEIDVFADLRKSRAETKTLKEAANRK